MLTQCAQCSTVFRLHAAQLAAASGFVTCGDCGAVFNALNRLADEPLPSAPAITPASSENDLATRPQAALDLNEAPAILRDDLARLMRTRHRGLSWAWSLLALVALLALIAQLAWQSRSWWSERYPAALPYAEKLCARFNCKWDSALDVKGIELVARDVREHPQYAHILLVNATLANRSAITTAYPIIQLGVYDRNGGIVGMRRFTPLEYLDASIDIARGMPAGRAVYVVLEVASASDVAESFEFTFM